jgi:hypothetical protein
VLQRSDANPPMPPRAARAAPAATAPDAGFALGPRINVGHREHAAPQQAGDLGGVDAIVLRLAAVNRFHVERMAEREPDRVILAQIGEPVPGEHAFAADDEPRAKGRHGVEEGVGASGQIAFENGLAGVIEDVGEHGSCVQVDAGVECVRGFVEAHGSFSLGGWAESSPLRGWRNPEFRLKDPRGIQLRLRVRYTWAGRPITRRDMRSIHSLQLTGARVERLQ